MNNLFHRRLTLDLTRVDTEARTVGVTIATDTPIPGPGGVPEILRHDADSIDLTRAREGLPLLLGHDRQGLPIGRVGEIKIDGGRTVGRARFGTSARASEAWADVSTGIVRDVSVGAEVLSWEETDDARIATRWAPVEVSIVGVGADPRATITRESKRMSESTAPDRREDIKRIFQGLDGEQWLAERVRALESDDSVADIRERVMARLKAGAAAPVSASTSVDVVSDQVERTMAGITDWFEYRAGVGTAEERRAKLPELRRSEFHGARISDLARAYLKSINARPPAGDEYAVVERAVRARAFTGHGTSHFTNLLANTAERMLGTGYTEAAETWRQITSTVNLSNFKSTSFPVLSTIGDLQLVREGEDLEYVSASDKVESMTLKSYAALFALTREAIVNDDLSAFDRIARQMGRAAARNVGDLVYTQITSNPTMTETARQVFNTTDTTLAASGGAMTVDTLNTAWTAMGKQTDPGGAVLNLVPQILLVPKAKENTARALIMAEKDPTTAGDLKPNVFWKAFSVVADARLDANSATAWYLFEAPGVRVDTLAVGLLNGRDAPTVDSEEAFTTLGITYRVVHDAVAGFLDYRGVYKNAGA